MFTIGFKPKALKEIEKLPQKDKERVWEAIQGLATDPYAGKKMDGKFSSQHCIRVWPYRVIYTIEKNILLVTVIMVGHRQGVYKRLSR